MRSSPPARRERRRSRPLLLERLEGRVVPSFFAPQDFGAGSNPNLMVSGDFNGDGLGDLAVASASSRSVSVLLGNGDSSFQSAVATAVPSAPASVAAGPFDSRF